MYFRTVRTVTPITGKGEPKHDASREAVLFQQGTIAWDRIIEPIIGQRLSYETVAGVDYESGALNLQTI